MANVNIFGSQVESALTSGFNNTILPAGEYSFMIGKVFVKPDNSAIAFTLNVLDKGEYESAQVSRWVNIAGEAKRVQRGLSELRSLYDLFALTGDLTDANVFINRQFRTKVQYKEAGMYNGKPTAPMNFISFAIDEMSLVEAPQAPQVQAFAPPTAAPQFTTQELQQQAPQQPPQAPNWG